MTTERLTIEQTFTECKYLIKGKGSKNLLIFTNSFASELLFRNVLKQLYEVYDMVGTTTPSKDAKTIMCGQNIPLEEAQERACKLNLPLIYVAGTSFNLTNKGVEPSGIRCIECFNPEAVTVAKLISQLQAVKNPDACCTLDGNADDMGYIAKDIVIHPNEIEFKVITHKSEVDRFLEFMR